MTAVSLDLSAFRPRCFRAPVSPSLTHRAAEAKRRASGTPHERVPAWKKRAAFDRGPRLGRKHPLKGAPGQHHWFRFIRRRKRRKENTYARRHFGLKMPTLVG